MKKIKSIALSTIAVALFGSAAMANAADLTANTTVTATVQEASGFTASWSETAQLEETQKLGSIRGFGTITLNGITGQSTKRNLEFSDAKGQEGSFTFTSPEGNSFRANIYGVMLNGQTPGGVWMTEGIHDGSTFEVRAEASQPLVAGHYSDLITVKLNNQ